MGRPTKTLITKKAVLEVALKIITHEGLDALSVRRIAKEIGVNAASLYYHFKNKDEIVVGAAELALTLTPLPLPTNAHNDWKKLLFAGVSQLRDFLLANPELLSVIVRRRLEGFANRHLEHVTQHLLQIGAPLEIIDSLFEALERITIGTAVREIADRQITKHSKNKLKSFPNLKAAADNRIIEPDEVFNLTVNSVINSMEQQFKNHKKTHKKKARI